MIAGILGHVAAGNDLSMEEMATAVEAIIERQCAEGEIGLLLTSLRAKGETAAEIAGAASALRRHMVPIRAIHQRFIDTCGTGGDGSGTFNISTAAALVTAAAGVPVAKHGNRSITSRSGSADVLAELGINIEAGVETVENCLNELGICFCFAPLMHPAMKQVAAVRKKLGVPTIFNLLGPLANPAGAPHQLLGVARSEVRPLLAEALALLGTRRSLVVHGEDGLDEVTLSGRTEVTEVAEGATREFRWQPTDFGLPRSQLDSLRVGGPTESAAVIRQLLAGQDGPARDIVVLNAAAALFTAGQSDDPQQCCRQAAAAIDSGAAAELLARLAELSQG